MQQSPNLTGLCQTVISYRGQQIQICLWDSAPSYSQVWCTDVVNFSFQKTDWKWALTRQYRNFSSVQFSLVAQSCPTLCDPMNRSTPGLPVHHQLPEFTQTHVHRVSDTIQLSHPLSSPSPPARNPSQHQGLFQWVNSLHEMAKGLEFQL